LCELSKDGESTPASMRTKPQKACIAGVMNSNATWDYGGILKLDSWFLDNVENNSGVVGQIWSRGQAQIVLRQFILNLTLTSANHGVGIRLFV
jgi:hypothetical protein